MRTQSVRQWMTAIRMGVGSSNGDIRGWSEKTHRQSQTTDLGQIDDLAFGYGGVGGGIVDLCAIRKDT